MKLAVAVDLSSDTAEDLVTRAAQWAVQMKATLDILNVEGPRYAIDWVRDPAVRSLMEAEADQLRRVDTGRLADLVALIPEACRGSARLLPGQAVRALVDASEDYDALLIATHGRTGVQHFWLGSVAEQVVRNANSPIIVLRLQPPD